jgi:hypothetical protein
VIGSGIGGIILGGGELLTTGAGFGTGRAISLVLGTDVLVAVGYGKQLYRATETRIRQSLVENLVLWVFNS